MAAGDSGSACPLRGSGVPLDAVQLCSSQREIDIPLDDTFLLTSMWIGGARPQSLMAYRLGFHGKARWKWYREGQHVNVSSQKGWHALPELATNFIRIVVQMFYQFRMF